MSRAGLILLAAASLGFAPAPFLAPKPGSARADLKALQGEWEAVRSSGVPHEVLAENPQTDVFVGDRLLVYYGKRLAIRWKVRLDPTRGPKWMDLMEDGEPPVFSVYRLEGDTLTTATWCKLDGPPARPVDFEPNQNVVVMVYKRKRR